MQKFRERLDGIGPLRLDKLKEFVKSIDKFSQHLKLPLQAVKSTRNIVSYSKKVRVQISRWKSMMERTTTIHQILVNTTRFGFLFKTALDNLDRVLGAVVGIRKDLQDNLPKGFSTNELHLFGKNSANQQKEKIKEYFPTLGSSAADGFSSQLPFKLTNQFSFSLESFQAVLNRLQHFSNNVLHMSYLLESFKDVKLPVLKLRFLERRSSTFLKDRFNFGLTFDWRLSLKFNLQLNSSDVQKLVTILKNVSDFFSQFSNDNFDLETFFREILPARKNDLKTRYTYLFRKKNKLLQ